jgi:hypothetical protein
MTDNSLSYRRKELCNNQIIASPVPAPPVIPATVSIKIWFIKMVSRIELSVENLRTTPVIISKGKATVT